MRIIFGGQAVLERKQRRAAECCWPKNFATSQFQGQDIVNQLAKSKRPHYWGLLLASTLAYSGTAKTGCPAVDEHRLRDLVHIHLN